VRGISLPFALRRPLAGFGLRPQEGLARLRPRAPLQPVAMLGYADCARGRSSVVEHQLPKLSVVGSIPIARSKFMRRWKALPPPH
jgi:hypothetical protein